MNILFKLPHRKPYTWTLSADIPEKIIRNQIYYIAASIELRNSIEVGKTNPGADIPMYHNPVIRKFVVELKKVKVKRISELLDIKNLAKNKKKNMQDILNVEIAKTTKIKLIWLKNRTT